MSFHHDPAQNERRAPQSLATGGVFPDDDQVRRVYQFIYRHVGNREEAEELTECVCRRAMRAAAQDSPDRSTQQSMESGLRHAAWAVIEERQARFYGSASEPRRGEESVDQSSSPNARLGDDGAMLELLHAALAQLSAHDRDFLTYRFLRNSSLAETAAKMRLSVNDALALQWSALNNAARVMAKERMKQAASGARPGAGISRAYPSAGGASGCRRSAACPC